MKSEGGHYLFLHNARNIDAQLEQIREMPEIEHILIDTSDLTAAGMKHIGTLPKLKRVTVDEWVGDEGLLALRDCKSLEGVSIYEAIEDRPASRSNRGKPPEESSDATLNSN